jgi:hypothetical protein
MAVAASQNDFAHALLNPDRPLPAGVTTARGEADASRFAIYRNNVFVGLTRALAQRFPVTERLVGTEFFTAMARAFAQDHKPASPLIIAYGDDFPDFIAGFEPAAMLDYLADVARIEAAWTRAYHAADAPSLDLAALSSLAPDDLFRLRLPPHPSAALVQSDHPVGTIWAAHQGEEVMPVDIWRGETVLVVRPSMSVNLHILPPQDAAFARALFDGASLGEAAEIACARASAFDMGAALVGLHALGAFANLHSGNLP